MPASFAHVQRAAAGRIIAASLGQPGATQGTCNARRHRHRLVQTLCGSPAGRYQAAGTGRGVAKPGAHNARTARIAHVRHTRRLRYEWAPPSHSPIVRAALMDQPDLIRDHGADRFDGLLLLCCSAALLLCFSGARPQTAGPSENRHSGTSQPMPHTAPLFLLRAFATCHRDWPRHGQRVSKGDNAAAVPRLACLPAFTLCNAGRGGPCRCLFMEQADRIGWPMAHLSLPRRPLFGQKCVCFSRKCLTAAQGERPTASPLAGRARLSSSATNLYFCTRQRPGHSTANSLTNHRFQKPVDAMQDHKSAIGRHQMNLQHHAKDLRGLQVTGAVEIGASKLGPAKPGSSATCFPIEIRHTPGRGRGFFATRDIAQGEVVLESAPLAWTVSSEWAKHVCLWCFRCSFRKAHAVKAAVDDCYRPGTGTGTDKSNAPPARYKGAFCSDGCKQAAVAAFGGQEKWASFVALLGNIDDEARRRSNRRPLRGTPHALPNALASDLPHDLCADSGFDPDEVSDDILEGWMDSVWSTIETYQLFQDSSLDSAQTDMVRLIASQAYLRDTVAADAASPGEIIDRQFGSVGVAPPEFLEPVKANEAETLRAWLRSVQADEHLSVEDAQPASPPATIAPIRLPWNPDPREIQQSRWGRSFEAAATAYMLLARAWKRTFGNTGSSAPTHRLFRAVYYREKANSFGIWDCPAATADADTDTDTDTDGSSGKDIDLSESECVGFAIYPSAVYFNHSCAPNVAKSRSERTYRFTSRRDIACDEELFIAYGSVSESAAERRKRLAEHFFFECSCERCIAETTIGDAAV